DFQTGLTWEKRPGEHITPKWTSEPSLTAIEKIVRRELSLPNKTPCQAEFLSEGIFNKVYTVTYDDTKQIIMRIPLPVYPRHKTMSEHATINYIRHHHSDIPIPNVLKCSSERDEGLGFEWMMMTYVPGTSLREQWGILTWQEKVYIVRDIAWYTAQLFKKKFPKMGSLYFTDDLQNAAFCLGPIVSRPFFWGSRAGYEVERGPFANSREWFAVELGFHILDTGGTDFDGDGDSGFSMSGIVFSRAQRLLRLVNEVFLENEAEFVLHHHDLSMDNIMIDCETRQIAGIVDWECVQAVPLWRACEMPKFLDTETERRIAPVPEDYNGQVLEDGTFAVDDMYFRHTAQFEQTKLREYFREEMGRVCPEWAEVYQARGMKSDLGKALA
ncbi:kinase-like protein, partial [Phaeosphaeriaceae sp. PMI808]